MWMNIIWDPETRETSTILIKEDGEHVERHKYPRTTVWADAGMVSVISDVGENGNYPRLMVWAGTYLYARVEPPQTTHIPKEQDIF
jgi:hypothetical protein